MAPRALGAEVTPASAGPENRDDVEFFRNSVRPILQRRCWKCHDHEHHKGDLDLTSREQTLAGGESGPAFDVDNPSASLLLSAVRYEGLEMPPTGQLPADELAVLEKWIQRGLAWDDQEIPSDAEPYISSSDRAHWSFQPIAQPTVPSVDSKGWATTPIDQFIWQQLQKAGLPPNGEASRAVLIRRLYLDIVGLPPTLDEVQAFENDLRPDAYERLVDRLLASPQYGEQWGRHWLDLVRFAETNSFERDNAKPFAWRYRDYVIQAFNTDKPYRDFVGEQLAGDELQVVTKDGIIATAYYRLGLWDDEPTDALQAYYDHLDDVVTVTSQVMMGLTINCARCHEHKIDPIPQEDYYRFMAFFHNIYKDTKTEGQTAFKSPFTLNTVRDIATAAERADYDRLRQEFEQTTQAHVEQIQHWEERVVATFSNPEREDARDAGNRARLIDSKGPNVLGAADWERLQTLRKEVSQRKPPAINYPQALSVRENGPQAPPTFVLLRGSAHALGPAVEPGFPSVLGLPDPPLPATGPHGDTSGRRKVVADWLFDPQNPLTARVIVNRLWQHHFGKGIVRSTNDFGLQGDRPTHPQLLDWLASELAHHDWSLKHLHRQMLLSSTYRMSSTNRADGLAADPQNHWLWRAEPRRLSAEQLRDAILAVNGSLNPTMAGPSVYPEIPQAVLEGQSQPGAGWGKSSPADQARRSIYVFVKRSLAVPLLTSFDAPDSDFSCPVRFTTTQPTQALTLLNSDELTRCSQTFATYLQQQSGNDRQTLVRLGLERALARDATAEQIERGVELIERFVSEHHLSEPLAIQQFCLMVLNLNEFIFVD